jgi:hypothetical protein
MMRAVLRGLLTDAQGRIDEMALLTILGLQLHRPRDFCRGGAPPTF